jgi:RHS repeat-associated protein
MSNTSRRTSITYPNGRVVNLAYGAIDSIEDSFDLVKSLVISGESGNKVEYTRAGLGRFVEIAYPQPGVEMSMIRPGGGSEGDSGDPYDGYDRFSRVQEMRWQSRSTGAPIDAWQWGFNEASNRTWKKNLVAASGQDEAYNYDGLYQIKHDAVGTLNTNRTAIGGVPQEEEGFSYDPTGNWLGYRKDSNGAPVLDQSRSNNKDNQLTQIDGSSQGIEYDRAGNAIKIRPGAGGDWNKHFTLIWDAWNRLVEVKDENGVTVQKNAYDGLSRRITKEAGGTVTHTYWSDRWKPLEERIGSATTASRSYLWGERPGHRDELVLRDRDTDGNGTLDERLYATMDYFNGTAILNTSGTVLERYAYSAFGQRRIMAADFSPRSTSGYAWDFGFQGQFRDVETGWSNYGYRVYVPLVGTWINRDPIGETGGDNLYMFVRNRSVNILDYLGLADEGGYPCKCDRKRVNQKINEMSERAGASSEADLANVPEAIRNNGISSGREFGGRVCCNGKTGEVSSTGPVPGPWRKERNFWVGESVDPKSSDACSNLGENWMDAGYYHSHPSGSDNFSPDDLAWSHGKGLGDGLPLGVGTPEGKTSLLEPTHEKVRTRYGDLENFPTGRGWGVNKDGSLTPKPRVVPPVPGRL